MSRFDFFVGIVAISFSSFAQETNLHLITIGTNTYKNVTIRKRNDAEAIIRFDGGIAMVRILELPEPIRSAWADTNAIVDFEQQRKASIQHGKAQLAREEEQKQKAILNQAYVRVGGKLVPRTSAEHVFGEVVRNVKGGVFVRKINERYVIDPPLDRLASIGGGSQNTSFAPTRKVGESYGESIFIRGLNDKPTGSRIRERVFDAQKTTNIAGVTAKVFDVGEIPFPPNKSN